MRPCTYIRKEVSSKGNCNTIPRFCFQRCCLRSVSTGGNVHAIVIFTALCLFETWNIDLERTITYHLAKYPLESRSILPSLPPDRGCQTRGVLVHASTTR